MSNISLYQSLVIGPDSLYCGIWKTVLKFHRDLNPDPTMPIIELSEIF